MNVQFFFWHSTANINKKKLSGDDQGGFASTVTNAFQMVFVAVSQFDCSAHFSGSKADVPINVHSFICYANIHRVFFFGDFLHTKKTDFCHKKELHYSITDFASPLKRNPKYIHNSAVGLSPGSHFTVFHSPLLFFLRHCDKSAKRNEKKNLSRVLQSCGGCRCETSLRTELALNGVEKD